jgi:hypothetical protein
MKCFRNFGFGFLLWQLKNKRLINYSNLLVLNKMEPHSIPNVTNGEFYDAELFQDLHENEHCPEGTIPIIRHAREDEYYPHGAISAVARNQKKLNIRVDFDAKGHEVYRSYIIK